MTVDFIKNSNNSNLSRVLPFFILIAIITYIDQLTKFYVGNILEYNSSLKIFPFLNLVSAWNHGISFGLFNDFSNINAIFIIINFIIIIILAFIMVFSKSSLVNIAISFIIGGALGNLIDRFSTGAVYDFIDFYIYDSHFPTFNLGDSAIFLGTSLYLISYLKEVIRLNKKEIIKK